MSDQMIKGRYGELESNHWEREALDEYLDADMETVELNDPGLARITRLRLLSDPGFPMWDLSYCWGEMRDGAKVRVFLPRAQFTKMNLKRELVHMARQAGVYAKGLGLLDDDVISRLT